MNFSNNVRRRRRRVNDGIILSILWFWHEAFFIESGIISHRYVVGNSNYYAFGGNANWMGTPSDICWSRWQLLPTQSGPATTTFIHFHASLDKSTPPDDAIVSERNVHDKDSSILQSTAKHCCGLSVIMKSIKLTAKVSRLVKVIYKY